MNLTAAVVSLARGCDRPCKDEMALFSKPLAQITKTDLQELIDDQRRESRTLEYKLQVNKDDPGQKADFCEDVCAFANADGGYIIVGIREKKENNQSTGLPEDFHGLTSIPDQEIRRLQAMIHDKTEPKVPHRIKEVLLGEKKYAYVIYIPRSWAPPHAALDGKRLIFWLRHDGGKHEMDIREIRSAFELSGLTSERIREFRKQRIPSILSGKPVDLGAGLKTILHVVPFSAFDPTARIDIASIPGDIQVLNALHFFGLGDPPLWHDPQYNFAGLLRRSAIPIDYGTNALTSYVQLFRNGAIEAVNNIPKSDDPHILNGSEHEKRVILALRRFQPAQQKLAIEPPFYVMLGLFGVLNYTLYFNQEYGEKFSEDVLELPEVLINSFDENLDEIMKPAFDVLANAAGWPGSKSYQQDSSTGKWARRTQR